jgi:hypothetical protein
MAKKRKSKTAVCDHCQQPVTGADLLYIVRSEVWAEAGMKGRDGGHLHLACIEERLGRKMRPVVDLLVWVFDKTPNGWNCRISPDYVNSPEFQNQKR